VFGRVAGTVEGEIIMKLTGTCLVVVMSLAPAALAATDTPKLSTAQGQVSGIDSAANTLTVKVDGKQGSPQDVTFVVAGESKIVKDDAAIELSALKQGDKVTVTYRQENGKNLVVNIGVMSRT
jgi:Cu/Ag efflux protein CusF